MAEGLVQPGIEHLPDGRLHRPDGFALEEGAELAIDRRDALRPRVVGQLGRAGLDGPVEVVERVDHLEPQRVGRPARGRGTLLLGPALVVEELGTLALQAAEIFVGLRDRVVALLRQSFDVGQELRRRDVDLGGTLLGPCSMRHGLCWILV